MILITGGKYQGKLEFAKKCASSARVRDMKDFLEEAVSGKVIVNKFNDWFRSEPETASEKALEIFLKGSDVILITEEVGSGVVPMSEDDRKYRERLGRTVNVLAERSDAVYRVFAGIPEKLK
ncbi:adenosylcobinamide kinase /adenosylcobinamide-phosphate guanylyltransferase [Lachnospiraceae bacterium]|nr:adenosylcobinamide kinase /adenosylcobinamide-phosphate guanylyltransferase [Lachnospiraceae bacterium]